MAAYALNVAACEAFYPLLHAVEIAFRNSVDRAISARLGASPTLEIDSWLDRKRSLLNEYGQRDVDDAKKKLLKRAAKTGGRRPNHADLVAALDFGFWTGLLADDYVWRSSSDPRWWPQLLPVVFPNYKRAITMKDAKQIRSALNDLRNFRNRVFHHEPILPKSGLVRLADVQRALGTQRAWILNIIGWISIETRSTVESFDRLGEVSESRFYRQLCFRLCSLADRS
ncbi:MAG TPA: hypothetical protein VJ825_06505 [Gemmatimonadaceae bacterium]|nr:hypothetical protein [Gemmatimonadaceae bacterium]